MYHRALVCIWFLAGFSGGLNFYAFAAGNPISFVDPSGMGPQEIGFGWIQRNLEPIRALQDDARIYGMPGGPITGAGVLSGTLNMIPLVSSAKAFVELNTGRDLITGQRSDRSDFSLASQAVLGAIILPPARAAGGVNFSVAASTGARQLEFPFVASVEQQAVAQSSRRLGPQITVLGAKQDTTVAMGWPGHNVLDVNQSFTPQENFRWLSSAVRRGDQFYLATDPSAHAALMRQLGLHSRYLDLELPYLRFLGFEQKGNWMVPKGSR